MSFLRGLQGATEGKYFKQEGEAAAFRLRQEILKKGGLVGPSPPPPARTGVHENGYGADVLPEILQHSPRLSLPQEEAVVRDSVIGGSKRVLTKQEAVAVARAAQQPIGTVPHTSFGRSKYQLDLTSPLQVVPSTANARRGRSVSKAQAEAMVRGLGQVSKAFAVATVLTYGGGILLFAATCQGLGVNSLEELPAKVKTLVAPKMEKAREHLAPIRAWAESTAGRLRLTEEEQRAVGARFAQRLGVKHTATPSAREP